MNNLDLSPAQGAGKFAGRRAITSRLSSSCIWRNYPRNPGDPRNCQKSVRLWFIHLDAAILVAIYTGRERRYAAMLVPGVWRHQYNPEALEIFLMQLFVLADWMQQLGIPSQSRLKSMARVLGYDLDMLTIRTAVNINWIDASTPAR